MAKKGPRPKRSSTAEKATSSTKQQKVPQPSPPDAPVEVPAPAAELPTPPIPESSSTFEPAVPVYEIDVDAHFASPTLARAKRQVFEEAERRATVRSSLPPPPARVSSGLLALALASWLTVAALLLLQPAIARGPQDQPWQPSPAVAEASLRYGLWLAHGRIESFVRKNERMPSFLAEAGVEDSSITLTVEQGRDYQLDGRQGGMEMQLTSRMAADSFLGTSRRQLTGR